MAGDDRTVPGDAALELTWAGRGNRRIDRVLAEDYLAGLGALPLPEVRALRAEAEQEETDLSYLRRMVQGRIDILGAELRRREQGEADGPAPSLVSALPQILADEPRAPARGLGRHTVIEPSRTDSHRRQVEALVADVDISDVGNRSTEELTRTLETMRGEEQGLSRKRKAVQGVMDSCSAEITRRYRDGEADVASLLSEA